MSGKIFIQSREISQDKISPIIYSESYYEHMFIIPDGVITQFLFGGAFGKLGKF